MSEPVRRKTPFSPAEVGWLSALHQSGTEKLNALKAEFARQEHEALNVIMQGVSERTPGLGDASKAEVMFERDVRGVVVGVDWPGKP